MEEYNLFHLSFRDWNEVLVTYYLTITQVIGMSGDFERSSSFGNKSTKSENIDEPAGQFCPSNPDSPLSASGKTNKGQNILP